MLTRIRSRYLRAAVTLAVAGGLLAASSALAGTVKPQNLTQLIADSQSIIKGTVKSVTDGIDERGVPYTEVTIFVRSSAKGAVADDSEYTFRQFGLIEPRKLDNGHVLLAVTPEGFPRWHEGETVIAFLYPPAGRTGLQTTAGLAQGKLTQVNDNLVNAFENVGMFAGVGIQDSLLNPEEREMLTSSGPVDAETFMNLVDRAISEQWIENGEMQ